MSRRDDYMLLDLWRRGDQVAGKELFERHFDMLFRFFATEMATGQAKLVVEAFRACLEARWPIRRHKSFRVHLLANAHRVLGTRYPRHRLHRDRALLGASEETDSSISSESDAAFDELLDSYSRSTVTTPPGTSTGGSDERLRALQRLPGEARALIELHEVERLSERDIAEVLDVPVASVRRALKHAREQLESALAHLAREGAGDETSAPALLSTLPRQLVEIVLDGDLARLAPGTFKRILEEARAKSGDPELTILAIRPGSVRVELAVSEEAAAMLMRLYASGDLTSLGGLPIIDMRLSSTLPGEAPDGNQASAEAALSDFLVSAFAAEDLRRFVRGFPDGVRLEASLPGALASLSHLAAEVVRVLVRHHLVGAALFERLEAERPHRSHEIHRIRRRFEAATDAGLNRLS